MGQRFIMTAFGKDRPGIAADVSEILYENGCNLEDTSMTLLAGEFTLILLFTAGRRTWQAHCPKPAAAWNRKKAFPLSSARWNRSETVKPDTAGFPRYPACGGLDQAGIVYKVSRFLADNRINIVDLKSTVKASPESGTAMYVMDIRVQIPAGTAMEAAGARGWPTWPTS
jgi:glycine cleavage system transcriptional repressor